MGRLTQAEFEVKYAAKRNSLMDTYGPQSKPRPLKWDGVMQNT